MSLRFRRSVRLFPGVRLNFSGSGISTTVGVRGASLTLGQRGTYANVGLPGSGLSYRTRLGEAPRRPATRGALTPELTAPPAPTDGGLYPYGAVEISSADVSALTSPGLGELKRLINEAALKRQQLTAAVSRHRREFDEASKRLAFAKGFIIRIFTQKTAPRLETAVAARKDELEDATAELEGCFVEVDFAFDDATHGTYAALVGAFEAAAGCQKIWDITSFAATNRVVERTVASRSLSRTPVQFDFTVPDIVKTSQQAMRLGEASGRPIYLYPGFVMMRDQSSDFALVEYQDVEFGVRQSTFVEEETVPSDTEVLGYTWKKANKDGSQDRRFVDNYQIPFVKYAELTLQSRTGLNESYQFSSYDRADVFARALAGHQRALQALARSAVEIEAPTALDLEPDPAPETASDREGPAAIVEPPPSLLFDWIALVLLIVAVMLGGDLVIRHRGDFARTPTTVAEPAPVVEAAAPKPKLARPAAKKKTSHAAQAGNAASEAASASADRPEGKDKGEGIPY